MVKMRREGFNYIRKLAKMHHEWRSECINLIASENITSLAVRELLASDFSHRYAEGEPFSRLYGGTKYIDLIEDFAKKKLKKVFGAEYVNLKPLSGSQANLAVIYALTNPGETIITLSLVDGGHISCMDFGGAGLRNLKVETLAFDKKEINIDVDASIKKIMEVKPSLCFLGGSVILFPQPVKEIKNALNEVGGNLVYDASHVLGLIAGKQFQDPLKEGSDIVTSSTHKTFPGPQGGVIFCKSTLAEKIDKAVFPGLVSNHHLHHIAALAVSLLEVEKFGVNYAKQIIKNAKALAESLYNDGFNVVAAHKGFTETHQILVDVSKFGGGNTVSTLLEKSNIICNKNLLPWDNPKEMDNPSGIRLGTAELTRLGLKEEDMVEISKFIRQVIIEKRNPATIAKKVKNFMKNFRKIHYSFKKDLAYKYINFY